MPLQAGRDSFKFGSTKAEQKKKKKKGEDTVAFDVIDEGKQADVDALDFDALADLEIPQEKEKAELAAPAPLASSVPPNCPSSPSI